MFLSKSLDKNSASQSINNRYVALCKIQVFIASKLMDYSEI